MGHAGSEGSGLDGVELALDKQLRGTASSVQGMRDALGRDIAVEGTVDGPSTAGSDVVLTIDRYLTFITERALAAGAAEHHAKGAVADHDGPAHGRGAGDGVGADLQPQRPAERGRRGRAQPRHHRHLRARARP